MTAGRASDLTAHQQSFLPLEVAEAPADPPATSFGVVEPGRPVVYTTLDSPVGELLLTGDGHWLTGLWFQGGRRELAIGADWRRQPTAFAAAVEQLASYFAGELTMFDLPLAPGGTAFQRRVWQALTTIGHGRTVSYGALAARLGQPGASRAVGLANGRNPIAVIVPCHRVIGADGRLTGYGGGLARKELLLRLERGQRI